MGPWIAYADFEMGERLLADARFLRGLGLRPAEKPPGLLNLRRREKGLSHA